MSCYVGVDPGMSGYIAVLDLPGKKVLEVHPFPVVKVAKGRAPNIPALTGIVRTIEESYMGAIAAVERVGPTQGSKAMFHFGGTYFAIQTALSYAKIPYVLVEPKEWLSHFSLSRSSKEKSVLVAGQLFPDISFVTDRGRKEIDKAEAVLIARWMHDKAQESLICKRIRRREV